MTYMLIDRKSPGLMFATCVVMLYKEMCNGMFSADSVQVQLWY